VYSDQNRFIVHNTRYRQDRYSVKCAYNSTYIRTCRKPLPSF